jgi:hypothetical protein
VPSGEGLRDLRQRIGVAPAKTLSEVLAGPLAPPATPGVPSGLYRTVDFDGVASIKVPGHEPNRDWLER